MTENDLAGAVSELAAERIQECIQILNDTSPADTLDGHAYREHHAGEFERQAVALITDAGEVAEVENDVEAAVALLGAADTYLEAIQDIVIRESNPDTADTVGHAREQLNQAQSLLHTSEQL